MLRLSHIIYITIILVIISIHPGIAAAENNSNKLIEQINDVKQNLVVSPNVYNDVPLRINVEDLDIELAVADSYIVDGTWVVDETKANYAIESSFLDEPYGNSIIFAHARKNMFIDLEKVTEGSIITVYGKKNIYIYKVVDSRMVKPEETYALKAFGDKNLTLFTCDGPIDEYRILIDAKRIQQYAISTYEEVI